MFILNVSYLKPPSQVEPHIASHGAWLAQHVGEGTFLFAGPKPSGLGGVIAAQDIERARLMEILAEDAYVRAGVAEYQIIEFACKLTQPALASLTLA